MPLRAYPGSPRRLPESAALLNYPQELHGLLKRSGNTEDARVSDDSQEGYFNQRWKCNRLSEGQRLFQPALQDGMFRVIRAESPDQDVGVEKVHASARLTQVGGEIDGLDSFLKV